MPRDNIDPEKILIARLQWAEKIGCPVSEVPWQVVFVPINPRPLTKEEWEWGEEIARVYGLE